MNIFHNVNRLLIRLMLSLDCPDAVAIVLRKLICHFINIHPTY